MNMHSIQIERQLGWRVACILVTTFCYRRRQFIILAYLLTHPHLRIRAIRRQQLHVRTTFDDTPMIQNQYLCCIGYRR